MPTACRKLAATFDLPSVPPDFSGSVLNVGSTQLGDALLPVGKVFEMLGGGPITVHRADRRVENVFVIVKNRLRSSATDTGSNENAVGGPWVS
jgi:hypothetical protein